MSLLRRAMEKRVVTSWGPVSADPARIPTNGELGASTAGVPVTESTALSLSAVAACVGLISDTISTLPLDAYIKVGKSRVEVEPTPSIVTNPFVDVDPITGMWQVVYSLVFHGNFFAIVATRDALLRPTSLAVVHPGRVSLRRKDGRLRYFVDGKEVARDDVVHIPGFTIPGLAWGLGPLDYARATIGLGLAQQDNAGRFFSQGSIPASVIEIPGEMDATSVDRMLAAWKKHHSGSYNAHEPGVLTGGAKISTLTISPEQAQFLESRKFQVAEVARAFRVFPWMIGDVERSTSWGTGIEVQGIAFVTYTLRYWLTKIESAWSRMLPQSQYAKFNVSALLRGDSTARAAVYQVHRQIGTLNADEIRALEELPPIPDGSGADYLQPLNWGPLGSTSGDKPPTQDA